MKDEVCMEPNELALAIAEKRHLTRHFDLIPQDKLQAKITVIGAGGIGSWVTFALAKMGFSDITVYDPDDVDIVNVGNQLYGFSDVGLCKVGALARICKNVGGHIKANEYLFGMQEAIEASGIIIMAVDSMKARKDICEFLDDDCFLIDGRMGAEKMLIYTAFDEASRDNYERSLYADKDAEQVPCTAKATSYCALTIAGLIAGQVKSYVQDSKTIKNLSLDAATGASIFFSH